MTPSAPFWRALRSLRHRPFGARRRQPTIYRLDHLAIAAALHEVRPIWNQYMDDDHFAAAVGVWDDMQRSLTHALRKQDRRAFNESPIASRLRELEG